MWKHVLTFTARSADATSFTIHQDIDYVDAGTRENPNALVPGKKRLRTTCFG